MTKIRKSYRDAYESSLVELESLLKQQKELEERIHLVRKMMQLLTTLLHQSGEIVDGANGAHARVKRLLKTTITADILQVINYARRPLTSTEVCDELLKLGGTFTKHKNPLATINTILKRLSQQKLIVETRKGNRNAWTARSNPAPAGSSVGKSTAKKAGKRGPMT